MDARELIFSRIGGPSGGPLPEPFQMPPKDIRSLWQEFETNLSTLGGRVVSWTDLSKIEGRRWCVDFRVGELPLECGLYETTDPWTADVGITFGQLAVAETGTILISHESADRRLASLAPPLHIAIVRDEDIVQALEEAIDRLKPCNSVLITGPSRTADIEGELVRGVHGPKEIWIVVNRT